MTTLRHLCDVCACGCCLYVQVRTLRLSSSLVLAKLRVARLKGTSERCITGGRTTRHTRKMRVGMLVAVSAVAAIQSRGVAGSARCRVDNSLDSGYFLDLSPLKLANDNYIVVKDNAGGQLEYDYHLNVSLMANVNQSPNQHSAYSCDLEMRMARPSLVTPCMFCDRFG
jgi:hypothetical protein